jgi:hypothetical protein
MQVYIELFRAKPAWQELDEEARAAYFARAGASIQRILEEPGVELLGVGSADPARSHDAGYDYFAVWKLPDRERVELFERGIEDDRWYDYFEQVNAGGELEPLEAVMGRVLTR